MTSWTLDELLDHERFSTPIKIEDVSPAVLTDFIHMMVKIRAAETKLAEGRRDGLIGGPVHLGVGQEAIATGLSLHARPTDRVFGGHRSHAHVLSLGASVHGLFAEVLGKATGLSHGMGGSMHLQDRDKGFYGSVPIVAGTVPLAAGAAMAAKMDGNGDVAVAYLGDGAVEEGVVQETLNLASAMSLPLIIVVENNLFASHMHISLRQSQHATSRFAAANGVQHALVDGNDVLGVSQAAKRMFDAARSNNTPGFIEAVTYRWLGHVDWRDDIDVGVSRSTEDLVSWKARDPISRLNLAMVQAGHFRQDQLFEIEQEINKEIETAWEQAVADPYPDLSATMDLVYANGDER